MARAGARLVRCASACCRRRLRRPAVEQAPGAAAARGWLLHPARGRATGAPTCYPRLRQRWQVLSVGQAHDEHHVFGLVHVAAGAVGHERVQRGGGQQAVRLLLELTRCGVNVLLAFLLLPACARGSSRNASGVVGGRPWRASGRRVSRQPVVPRQRPGGSCPPGPPPAPGRPRTRVAPLASWTMSTCTSRLRGSTSNSTTPAARGVPGAADGEAA